MEALVSSPKGSACYPYDFLYSNVEPVVTLVVHCPPFHIGLCFKDVSVEYFDFEHVHSSSEEIYH